MLCLGARPLRPDGHRLFWVSSSDNGRLNQSSLIFLRVTLSKWTREICDPIKFVFLQNNAFSTVRCSGQRKTKKVVCELEGCTVYLEGVVIYSDTWEEHLLRILFDRLIGACFTADLSCPIHLEGVVAFPSLLLYGYYCGFVCQFCNCSDPNYWYVWSPICQKPFDDVKNLLSSAPVLAPPLLDLPFQLQMDVL